MTSTEDARYIDFHSHFYDPTWFSSPVTIGQGVLARAWPLLTDIEAQLAAMVDTKIDAKVLTAPSALLIGQLCQSLHATMLKRCWQGLISLSSKRIQFCVATPCAC